MTQNPVLLSAAQFWRDNQPLEAGRVLFEALPANDRPYWALAVLEFAIKMTGARSPVVDDVIRIAKDPRQWHKGHAAFSATRDFVLYWDKRPSLTPNERALKSVAVLAEKVAKVTYNATNPADEFDENSGWYVVSNLYSICKNLNEASLNEAWIFLSSKYPTLPPCDM